MKVTSLLLTLALSVRTTLARQHYRMRQNYEFGRPGRKLRLSSAHQSTNHRSMIQVFLPNTNANFQEDFLFRSLRGADSFSYSYAYRQDGHEYFGIGKADTKGAAKNDANIDTKNDTKNDTNADRNSDTKGDAPKIVSEPHEDKAAASSNAGSSLSEPRTSIIPRTTPNDASSSTSGSSSASALTAKDVDKSGPFIGTPDRPNKKDAEALSTESTGAQPTFSATADGAKPTLPTSSTSTTSSSTSTGLQPTFSATADGAKPTLPTSSTSTTSTSTPGAISSKEEDSTGPREKANSISNGNVDSVNDSTVVTSTSNQVSAAKSAQQTGDNSRPALIASIIAACAAALILATAIGYVVVQRRAAMKATVA